MAILETCPLLTPAAQAVQGQQHRVDTLCTDFDESVLLQQQQQRPLSMQRHTNEVLLPTTPPLLQNAPDDTNAVLKSVGWSILLAELLGTFGYKAMTGSLAIFFRRDLQISNALATELTCGFFALCNLTPLLGGYLADKYLGRYTTIMVFYPILLNGILLCLVGAFPTLNSSGLFMIGLFGGMALGTGGLKPNVIVLGADQFDGQNPCERTQREHFFNWLYWVWNIGSTLSIGLLSNVSVNGLTQLGFSARYGFFTSFVLAFVAFGSAFGVYASAGARLRRIAPHGSALDGFCGVVWQASSRSARGRVVLGGLFAFVPGILITTVGYVVTNPWWHFVVATGGALYVGLGAAVLIIFGNDTRWLEKASTRHGGSFSRSQVHDVALVVRLLPIMSLVVTFWTVYGQISSNFLLQGCQMDLRYGDQMISSALLSVLVTLVIIVFIPILDGGVYPMLKACGIHPTLLRKIGAGMVCAALAMVAAGLLEQKRRSSALIPNVFSNCAKSGEKLPLSSLSVWWQTPQYVLIGIAEILTSIASCEFFYSQVPESMRSVCQSLNLLTRTLGFILGGGISSLLASWVPRNLNDGHLEFVFFGIATLASVAVVAFSRVTRSFEYYEEVRWSRVEP